MKVTKTFNGVKTNDDFGTHFSWTITIKGEDFKWHQGLGHSSLKKNPNKNQISVTVSDDILRKAYSWKQLDARPRHLRFRSSVYVDKPKISHVLNAIARDYMLSIQSFDDFCESLALNADSRKALDTYLECQRNGERLAKVIGHGNMERIAEWEL